MTIDSLSISRRDHPFLAIFEVFGFLDEVTGS
jgi:hypothetical protein